MEITVAARIRQVLDEVPHLVVAQRGERTSPDDVSRGRKNDVDSVRFVASIAENPFARISKYDMRHLLRHLRKRGRASTISRRAHGADSADIVELRQDFLHRTLEMHRRR